MDDVRDLLGLQPHPEGGWFAETWRTAHELDVPGRDGVRATATGIYFSLGDGESSAWHRVESDELWLHHLGPAIELETSAGDPSGGEPVRHVLGPDVAAGERPQVLVPAGHWQRARPAAPGRALVSCVVSPGFDFRDFRLDATDAARQTGAMVDDSDTTQQVLESAQKLLAGGGGSVNDQYVADDTGLPTGVVRDALLSLDELDTQVFEDGSVSVTAAQA